MKEQRVLVTGNDYAIEVQDKVDVLLEHGWQVVSVTAQYVATTGNSSQTTRGGYFIVFEREKQK
jgi:hypothetical protein